MPITRRQFELGIDDVQEQWMVTISRFLEDNKNQAFSLQELGQALGLFGRPDHLYALNRLVELGVASEREVAGVVYYATGRYTLDDVLKP